MDTSLTIVSLLLVGSVFLPFFLLSTLGKKETKKLKAEIKAVKTKNNLKVSQEEFWGDNYMGIDPNQKKLIFFKSSGLEKNWHLLDLNKLKGCKVIEKRKVIKIKNKRDSLLERLDLELLFKNGDVLLLPFFDAAESHSEDFENRRIEKWKAIIFNQISTASLSQKVA